jgi:hypothetical protein
MTGELMVLTGPATKSRPTFEIGQVSSFDLQRRDFCPT